MPLNDLQIAMLPTLWGAFDIPDDATGSPWDALRSGDPDALEALLAGPVESIVAIRAARMLRAAGRTVTPGATYGALLVIPLDEWTDLLAAYSDGAVRYYNGAPNGGGTVVDGQSVSLPSTTAFVTGAGIAIAERAPQESPPPRPDQMDVHEPAIAVFRSDGERISLVSSLDAGGVLMPIGFKLFQEVGDLPRS